jgi:soluble lytic murein transglycosylase-like protein
MKIKIFLIFGLLTALLVSGCSRTSVSHRTYQVKDNKQSTWKQHNLRIETFYRKYNKSGYVKHSLKRGMPYLGYIHQVFRYYKLPPELAYLPLLESSFNTRAVSRTGAKGLWQFKAGTARDCGLRVNGLVDERLNWKKSTIAAAKYLDQLGKRFNYNWELALAGYNGGPNYISRNMKNQSTWDFWRLKLRSEPGNYVPRFLAMLKVAREKYPSMYYGKAPHLLAMR